MSVAMAPEIRGAADFEAIYGRALETHATPVTPDEALRLAQQATGLLDFGGERYGEANFRKRLQTACDELAVPGSHTANGVSRANSRIHILLCSRLLLIDRLRNSTSLPQITAPLVGTGFPRSGTSFTHDLLAQDPENIYGSLALGLMPVPPPGDAQVDAARDAFVERFLHFQGLKVEKVEAVHPFDAAGGQECVGIQETTMGPAFYAFFNMPRFTAMVQEDTPDMYAWQVEVMRVLQSGARGKTAKRWALKAPRHAANIAELMQTFPDACVYVNHRDPFKVMASVCSMLSGLGGLNTDVKIDPRLVGPALLKRFSWEMDQFVAWREAHPEQKIVDIQYKELIADPIGHAEHIYSAFGLTLSATARQRMSDFLKVNRHGTVAKHRYDLAEFGLTEDMIDAAFESYVSRYRIIREQRG